MMRAIRKTSSWTTLKLKTMLSLRYSFLKAPFPDEQKAIGNRFDPLHAKYRDVFDEVPEDCLRWRVSARTSSSTLSKAVLRTRLGRRWNNAFADVLRNKGYELDGRRVVDGQKSSGLQGTLEILIHAGRGMQNPYKDLLNDARVTVEALEKMLQTQPAMRQSPGSGARKEEAAQETNALC